MKRAELTFDVVDDLAAAFSRGKLDRSKHDICFAPSTIGPLIELGFESNKGRYGPLLATPWLDTSTQADLRAALMSSENMWLDSARRRGFLRTVYDPLNSEHDGVRTSFLMAARISAEAVGFAIPTAQSITAAIREMESNVHEHSNRAQTGIIAFQATAGVFEFVVSDSGVGILATLCEAPEFKNLNDHGRALYAALQDNTSRYGQSANRENGFRDLFLGLTNLNADLRFRSGDHALSISGAHPELKQARLAQKASFQGFLASVSCRVPGHFSATH